MQAWTPKNSTTTSKSTSRRTSGTRRRSAWYGTRPKRGPSPAPSASLPRSEPERRDGLEEAAQLERPDRLGVGERCGFVLELGGEREIAGAGRAAQARSDVRYVPDRRVFPALLEAADAEGRPPLGDADAQAHVVA